MNYNALGEKIRLSRKKIGLNQGEFGEKLQLSRVQIGRMESGKCGTTLATLEKIADLTGEELSWFLESEPRENQPGSTLAPIAAEVERRRPDLVEYLRGYLSAFLLSCCIVFLLAGDAQASQIHAQSRHNPSAPTLWFERILATISNICRHTWRTIQHVFLMGGKNLQYATAGG